MFFLRWFCFFVNAGSLNFDVDVVRKLFLRFYCFYVDEVVVLL